MKISKKLVVSSLTTTMALSFVATLAGTLAWYQYNTRVSTTTIGTNVAETGALQISTDESNWGRDLVTKDLIGSQVTMKPVTFGSTDEDGKLPAQGYMKPEASENGHASLPGSYAEVYEEAVANTDYIQYTVYIRAMEVNDVSAGVEQVSKAVYLSDITFDDVGSGKIASGLRAHLAIDTDGDDTDDKWVLLSKEGGETQLSGVLDLDGNGRADHVGGPEWNENREDLVIYGNEGEWQVATAADDIKATRDGNGILSGGELLFNTHPAENVRVTVTLWVEGWDHSIGEQLIDLDRISFIKYSSVADYSPVAKGLYEKVLSGDYVKTADVAKVPLKQYYQLVNLVDDTTPENNLTFVDENLHDNASLNDDISSLFLKDSDNNYVHAKGPVGNNTHNVKGQTYHTIESTDKSGLTLSAASAEDAIPNGWISAEKMQNNLHAYLEDGGVYTLGNEENNYEHTYYTVDTKDVELKNFASDSFWVPNTWYKEVASELVRCATNTPYDASESYFTNAEGTAPLTLADLDGMFEVPNTWYKLDGDNYEKESGSDLFDHANSYYSALAATALLVSDIPDNDLDVSGYFVENPSYDAGAYDSENPATWQYIAATGTYKQGTTYYTDNTGSQAVVFALADFNDKFNAPDSWYKLDGDNYNKENGASAFDANASYFTAISGTAVTVDNPALNDLFDAKFEWFVSDGGVEIVQVGAEKNVNGAVYYKDSLGAEVAELTDLANEAVVDMSAYSCTAHTGYGIYVYDDSAKSYTPATGRYNSSKEYVEMKETVLNPTLEQLPSDTVKEGKLNGYYWKIFDSYFAYKNSSNIQGYNYYVLDTVTTNPGNLDAENSGSHSLSGNDPMYYQLDADDNYIAVKNLKNIKGVHYYSVSNYGKAYSTMWTGKNTDGAKFHFGLTFDVGKDAFKN